jgi:hypothetical protein
MTRSQNTMLLVCAILGVLLACASWALPQTVWNMSAIPRLLLLYGAHSGRITLPLFLVLLTFLLLWFKLRDGSSTAAITLVLVLLAIAVTGYAAVQNFLISNTVLSYVNVKGNSYYLIEHGMMFSYSFSLYECDHRECHLISVLPPHNRKAPETLRIDAAHNILQVLDYNGQVVYGYGLPD